MTCKLLLPEILLNFLLIESYVLNIDGLNYWEANIE